ncbi:MAG: DNA polymerase III subunit delta [Acidobacteriota bacterium]|nr:DNA polymerase III subunit delta [Acidobacteriota bacterium]MDQ5837837.1 DNA polymerase III subunit delta [Acidobacteriota bacterium]
MSTITREELWRRLKGGKLDPLYLLFGPEDYLRDAAARAVADAALKGAALREFNESAFSLATTDVQQALAAAEQLPMMAARRVVRVSDFARLRESDEEALARYVARPAETSVVIFVAGELDKRRRLSKTLLEVCTSVEFAALSDAELAAWARDRLKHLGASADERTLRQIIALTGASVRQLANELEKLSTAALPGGHISMESVEALVGRSRELSNFELTDHLIARDRRRALATLSKLLDDGAEPVMLIGLLASSYHRLALAKDLMSRGAPNEEVFRVVPMPLGKRKEFLATARRADARELEQRLRRIAEADLAIKTSRATPRLQLEMLVCELSA